MQKLKGLLKGNVTIMQNALVPNPKLVSGQLKKCLLLLDFFWWW